METNNLEIIKKQYEKQLKLDSKACLHYAPDIMHSIYQHLYSILMMGQTMLSGYETE